MPHNLRVWRRWLRRYGRKRFIRLGNRVADQITARSGSWLSMLVHVAWFAGWLVLALDINLLTMIVSLEAILLAIIIQMSQNRSESRDRAHGRALERMEREHGRQLAELVAINHQQSEELRLLHEILAEKKEKEGAA